MLYNLAYFDRIALNVGETLSNYVPLRGYKMPLVTKREKRHAAFWDKVNKENNLGDYREYLKRRSKYIRDEAVNGRPGVYILHAVGTRYYKIGRATNITKRIKGIQTSNPHRIELVKFCETDGRCSSVDIEKIMHEKFKKKHFRGEWFTLTQDDFTIFDQICENFDDA